MPSLLGAMILLFGNSFAAYATAYGLTAGGVSLVPITIGFFYTGDVLSNPHLGEALALGMFVVLARHDARVRPAAAAGIEVVAVKRWISPGAVVWILVGAAYFLIPLIATLLFSLRKQDTGKCCTLANYGEIIDDPAFWTSMRVSFIVALETIVISLAAARPYGVLGQPQAPAAAPGDRLSRPRPVRRAADRPRRGPVRRLPGLSGLVLRGAVRLPARRVRDPRVPVHLLLARRRLPRDRHPHADRGVAEPRGRLVDDDHARDPSQHPGRR